MRLGLFFIMFFWTMSLFGQFRLYEEGIKKYEGKDYYAAIELFSDFLTKPLHDKKFDADAHYWRGLAAFRLKDYAAASDDLKQSLALNHPNTGNIHWFLAKCLASQNQYNEASVEYGNALRILGSDKKKQSQILAERAQVYVSMDNTAAAQQDLQIASSLDPANQKLTDALNELNTAKSRSTSVPNTLAKGNEKKTETKTTPPVTQQSAKKEEPVVTQPVAQKQEEKKPESIAQKQEEAKPNEQKKEEKKTEAVVAKNDPPTVAPVVVTPQQSVPPEPKEPTLAELFKDEKRFALVIGNSAYPKEIGVLKNPANDATDFAAAIKNLGFEVTLITDASYGKIRAEMMKFRDKLNSGERDKTVGLFYYAGHGLQHDGENYIVPVDAELQYEDDISRFCFPIQKMVLTQMENTNSRMNIVVLDACRNNPFPALHRGIGDSQGLGEMKKARGAFIAYATSPGSVASDGTGRNGLYTQELIKAMNKSNRTIEQVFKDVRAGVLRQSGDKQNPWENSNIVGDFYFKLD